MCQPLILISSGFRLGYTYLVRCKLLSAKVSTGWNPAAPCGRQAWTLWVLAAGNSCQKLAAAAEPCREYGVCRSAQDPCQLPLCQSVRRCGGSGPTSPQKSISPCSQCCSVTCKSSKCHRDCAVAAPGSGRLL